MMTVTFWFPIQTDRKEIWATSIAKFKTVGGFKNLGGTMVFKFYGFLPIKIIIHYNFYEGFRFPLQWDFCFHCG